MITKTQLTRKV